MLAAEFVQLRQQRGRRERLAVHSDGIAVPELDLDIFRLVGRLLGIDGPRIDEIRRLFPGVFQHLALGRDVQEVGRSEGRRVGKESVSTCSYRGSPDHKKKKTKINK